MTSERMSDSAFKRMLPLYVRSDDPAADHKCGGCNMRVVSFDGGRARCTVVHGEISLENGTCNYWAPGPAADVDDIAPRRMDKAGAGYVEFAGKVNCSTCSFYASGGSEGSRCRLWVAKVEPGDCCISWEKPEGVLTEDNRPISRRWARALNENVGFAVTDRYDALGIAPPDPATMCRDQCEGTGWVPICEDDPEEPWRSLWLQAEAENPSDDGWHFVRCPTCEGTGKARPHEERVARITEESEGDTPGVRAAKRAIAEALGR